MPYKQSSPVQTAVSCRGCLFFFIVVTGCLAVLISSFSVAQSSIIEYQFRVIDSFKHSRDVFTQGLEFHDGILYESAGLHGQSRLFTRTLYSTTPIRRHWLDKALFAEGITVLNNKLYQLTWQSGRAFVYDAKTLVLEQEFGINGEGWGLANDGKHLIISNGSHQLTFLNPDTKAVLKTLDVTYNGKALNKLNELEWINGVIYANIWHSNWIVMISPSNGAVIGKVNLSRMLPEKLRSPSTNVLNGIAYDKNNKRLLVTGKNWPKLYHIELYSSTKKHTHKPGHQSY